MPRSPIIRKSLNNREMIKEQINDLAVDSNLITIKSDAENFSTTTIEDEKSSSIRSSSRQIKRKTLDISPKGKSKKKTDKAYRRQCEKVGCKSGTPICFASSSDRCVGSGYTSRWYHITSGEHYCNECFDYYYRSYRGGNKDLMVWKQEWSSNSRIEPSIKTFFNDQLLPFWAQCTLTLCQKWRQLSKDTKLTPDYLHKFHCGMAMQKKLESACDVPEDYRVAAANDPQWFDVGNLPIALLIDSPAAKYLKQYYPDGVGLSPTSDKPQVGPNTKADIQCTNESYTGCKQFLQPFYQPTEPRRALCMRPDVMEPEEIKEFPEYCKDRVVYLGVRNTILAMWNQNPKEWLTYKTLSHHLICRGLSRIRCLQIAGKVLNYLTLKAVINFGIIKSPPGFSIFPKVSEESVIVIGSGPSGLSAARHLQNLGFAVKILEARNRIGGRICDTHHLGGICVGKGAQIVTGVINNLITVMCEQAGIQMRIMGEKCDLYDEDGKQASSEADQRVDFHFNAMLDSVAEWRKNHVRDNNLYDKLTQMHRTFSKDTGYEFSDEEERLLQFHISNLEYACGSHLRDVSAINWDQNEQYPQFAGQHTLLPFGYSSIMNRLAEGLDLRFNNKVSKIDYSNDNQVIVTTADGNEFKSKRVIVTVPLAVLQKRRIMFSPQLPAHKIRAMDQLGSGIIEKVGLHFSTCFWEEKLQGSDFFGHIPSRPEDKGLFSIFYDLTPTTSIFKEKNKSAFTLMTYISGDAVNLLKDKVDTDIVEMCLDVLRKIFNTQVVPNPLNWFVSRWLEDPYAGMAYSYIKVGGSGEAYDNMAEQIDNKVFFAGEATNRQFPQTVSGAILSGVREAWKITSHVGSL